MQVKRLTSDPLPPSGGTAYTGLEYLILTQRIGSPPLTGERTVSVSTQEVVPEQILGQLQGSLGQKGERKTGKVAHGPLPDTRWELG